MLTLYNTIFRQFPEIILPVVQSYSIPFQDPLQRFSYEISQHFHLLSDETLFKWKDFFDWDIVLQYIPFDQMSRLLFLTDLPWVSISGRDYIPLDILQVTFKYINKTHFKYTVQSVEVLKRFGFPKIWIFVTKFYPIHHSVFRDLECIEQFLNFEHFWERKDLTEDIIDTYLALGRHEIMNWFKISKCFLSENQYLIEKYKEFVIWNALENLEMETIEKYARFLQAKHVLESRWNSMSVETAERILGIKDLKMGNTFTVYNIKVNRDFLIKYKDHIDFKLRDPLSFMYSIDNYDPTNGMDENMIVSCIEYIDWNVLKEYWLETYPDSIFVQETFTDEPIIPIFILSLRSKMEYRIDWNEMQNRILETNADITVDIIKQL